MIMNRKKSTTRETEGAEFGLDSRYVSKKERLSEGKALMEARLKRMKHVSEEQILKARLMQLKLQIEDYLGNPVTEDRNYFTDFLSKYIDTLYSRRSNFARDIGISPVSLSQVLNKHREPKVEFMQRLMLHSDQVYKHIGPFPMETWFRLYYAEKINEIMSRQDQWGPAEEKHVEIREPMETYGKILGN